MTIVEFLHPHKGKTYKDLVLAALYFSQRYNDESSLTVSQIRTLLKRAKQKGAAKTNLAAILADSAPYVDSPGKSGNAFLWALTPTGEKHVRSLLGLPEHDVEIEHDVSS